MAGEFNELTLVLRPDAANLKFRERCDREPCPGLMTPAVDSALHLSTSDPL
jgi:hypothetical protein